jgi:hypothetical protein
VDLSQLTPSETGTETVKYEPVAGIREAVTRYAAKEIPPRTSSYDPH